MPALNFTWPSGTDEVDVIKEAEALGYAHLFEGRIYGAVGDVTKEAKKWCSTVF